MPLSEIQDSDRDAVAEFIQRHWDGKIVTSRGKAYYPHEHPGLIERRDGNIVGLLTYRIDHGDMHVLTLNSTLEGQGIGTSMMLQAIDTARKLQCKRMWLTATNDNLRAVGFYQRLGFRMVAIHLGAADEARKIKPQIPEVGERGVPIHDEVVMELPIEPYLDDDGA